VRQSVTDLCVQAGLSEFKAAQLEMAVDEACSTVIEQNGRQKPSVPEDPERKGLRVNLIHKRDSIVVEMYDYGPGINFAEAEVVDPEHYAEHPQESGLRLYVIKRFVDDFQYEAGTPSGNCLRLTKKL
ncbi:MAG: ATP-binding protein, partial [Kiritimatiellae bacterium]|nr:ATP-binding protein [Kiritimatiellia bacterium]